jgi:toxin-antitoxin system PIN domain toxin
VILLDVNVLVYAHREDAVDHTHFRTWLEEIIQRGQPYGISDLVLSGFLRVVTHPRIFQPPSPIRTALDFVRQIRA